MARWKAHVEFLLSVIELLFYLLQLRHYKAKCVKTCCLQKGVGHLEPRFQVEGVFWTISTIKDEKSAAKFHYIKTVSGKVVAQSIAFRVVSIYWQGVAPFP